MIFFSENI